MLSAYDYLVIAAYFGFMFALGLMFRDSTRDTSSYFRGDGKMLWWIVGASAFMTQFSAWTFTGAAGKAYENGIVVIAIYAANALGFLVNYLGTAQRLRQMRIITTLEGIRQRWGRGNEQFFTWLSVPVGVLTAGITLNGLGVILSAVFGIPVNATILVAGAMVVFIATTGGSWATTASDFVQMLLLMAVTGVAAVLSLHAVGGLGGFLARAPEPHLVWGRLDRPGIMTLWLIAVGLKQLLVINNMSDGYRYLCAKDDRHARRGALLAFALFLVGPLVWFIPPMVGRILLPDLSAVPALQHLGARAVDGAYLAVCLDVMPRGMVGLMVTGLFAATMSSMDSGLNKNTGIFIRSFYLAIARPRASESELVAASKLMTIVFGVLAVLAGLYFSQLQELSLFNLMQQFTGLVSVPIAVPLFWGIFFRRTPAWSGWSTVLVCLAISLVAGNLDHVFGPAAYQHLLGLGTPPTPAELPDIIFFLGVVANIVVGSAWFLATSRWYGREPRVFRETVERFFTLMRTPVDAAREHGAATDGRQLRSLGRIAFFYGGFVALLAFIPNPLAGRLGFLAIGGLIGGVGLLLLRSAAKSNPA